MKYCPSSEGQLVLRLIPQDKFIPAGQCAVDPVDDDLQVGGVIDEVEVITADRQYRAQVEVAQPLVVERFQQSEVLGADPAFDLTSAALDALNEHLDRRPQVDQ